MVKEEIEDDIRQLELGKYNLLEEMTEEMEEEDEIIATVILNSHRFLLKKTYLFSPPPQYDIMPIANDKYKCMSVTGLKDVLVRTRDSKVHLRVDLQEFKITAKTMMDDSPTVWVSRQTNHLVDTQAYLFRLPIASISSSLNDSGGGGGQSMAGSASNHHHYQPQPQHLAAFVPIASQHVLNFLEREQRPVKSSDEESKCHEDVYQMPIASRNKHQQLTIEMRTRVYRAVERVKVEDSKTYDKFIDELFARRHGKARQLQQQSTELGDEQLNQQDSLNTSNNANTSITTTTISPVVVEPYEPYADILSCPHWQMSRLNLSDIRRLDDADLQLQALLRKGQVMTFAEMRDILAVEDTGALLNSLPTFALLVFGNWVVKSHLLYQIDALLDSEATQAHYRDLIAARDYLLWTLVARRGSTFEELYPKFKVIEMRRGVFELNYLISPFGRKPPTTKRFLTG